MAADQFGKAPLERGGARAEQAVMAAENIDGRLIDRGEIVSQEMGRERGMIIHVALAIDIPDVRALAAHEGDGRIDDPVRRADAARDVRAIAGEQGRDWLRGSGSHVGTLFL